MAVLWHDFLPLKFPFEPEWVMQYAHNCQSLTYIILSSEVERLIEILTDNELNLPPSSFVVISVHEKKN